MYSTTSGNSVVRRAEWPTKNDSRRIGIDYSHFRITMACLEITTTLRMRSRRLHGCEIFLAVRAQSRVRGKRARTRASDFSSFYDLLKLAGRGPAQLRARPSTVMGRPSRMANRFPITLQHLPDHLLAQMIGSCLNASTGGSERRNRRK
jgi:hypothetical protein